MLFFFLLDPPSVKWGARGKATSDAEPWSKAFLFFCRLRPKLEMREGGIKERNGKEQSAMMARPQTQQQQQQEGPGDC
jgi:hypothetical protein